jgi:hypothetical protein
VGGHIATWDTQIRALVEHCGGCGEPILTQCPACKKGLDGRDYTFVNNTDVYDAYCNGCGTAYPWRADAIHRAKRALADEADIEQWNTAVTERATEMIDDISRDRTTGAQVITSIKWLGQRGGDGAKAIILDTIKSIGSEALKGYLKGHGLLS